MAKASAKKSTKSPSKGKATKKTGSKKGTSGRSSEQEGVIEKFNKLVNMEVKELKDFLKTKESKEVGWGEGESVGHQSGRRIVDIKSKKAEDLTDDDVGHMKKVNAYCSRHLKQGPSKDVEHSKWRYSLMNWGHDPLKK